MGMSNEELARLQVLDAKAHVHAGEADMVYKLLARLKEWDENKAQLLQVLESLLNRITALEAENTQQQRVNASLLTRVRQLERKR